MIGTGSIKVSDPAGLVETRLWHTRNYPRIMTAQPGTAACMPCINNDRKRNSYYGGESMCADEYWYIGKQVPGRMGGDPAVRMRDADIAMK